METEAKGHVREGLALAAACFVVYALLQQDILYGDGAVSMAHRAAEHPWNHHCVAAMARIGAWWTNDPFDRVAFAMRAFVAIGVFVAHRTTVALGFDRERRVATTLLVGLTGVTIFYATVVELQGAYFPFAAFAFDRLVRCGIDPSAGRAVQLGVATGIATSVHATGHTVLATTLPWLLLGVERRVAARIGHVVRCCVVSVGVHFVVVAAVWLSVDANAERGTVGAQVGLLAKFAAFDVGHVPFAFVREWLLPFLPGSVLLFVAVAMRPLRSAALPVVCGFLVTHGLSQFVLRDFDERGAYGIALVFPLAVVVVRALSDRVASARTGLVAAVVCAGATGLALRDEYARTLPDPPTRGEVDAITEQGAALVCYFGPWTARPLLRHRPELTLFDLSALADRPIAPDAIGRAFDAAFTAIERSGRRLVMPAEGVETMHRYRLSNAHEAFFHGHFLLRYHLDAASVGGFRYFVVSRRHG